MSTYEFRLDDVRVITRGGLLNSALVEEVAKECGIDPFDLFGREEEVIQDFVTTAILEPYRLVKHCLVPIERFEFEFLDIDDVGGMVTFTATAVFSNDLTHTITVRTNSTNPHWKAFYKLFWLHMPNIDRQLKTKYYGVGGDGRVKLYPYVMCDAKLPTSDRFARLHSPLWRIQEFNGGVTAGLMVTGMFSAGLVETKFFGLYDLTTLVGDFNVEAPVEFLSDGVKCDIELIEKILSK